MAYHAYQSFKPGEVTPELCHRLGVELAKRMWGDEYQVLVATHFNTGTFHNHFVVNSVGLWNGITARLTEPLFGRLHFLESGAPVAVHAGDEHGPFLAFNGLFLVSGVVENAPQIRIDGLIRV